MKIALSTLGKFHSFDLARDAQPRCADDDFLRLSLVQVEARTTAKEERQDISIFTRAVYAICAEFYAGAVDVGMARQRMV